MIEDINNPDHHAYHPDNKTSYRYFVYGLIRQLEPQNVLEIGLGPGTTGEKILQAIVENKKGHYYIIDSFLDFSQHLINKYDKNLYTIINLNSRDINAYKNLPELDLICVDANHSEEFVYSDTVLSSRKLNSNGTIIWHDINIPDVERAVNRCKIDLNLKILYFPEINLAIGKK